MRFYCMCSYILLLSLVFLFYSEGIRINGPIEPPFYGLFRPVKDEQCRYKGYTPGGGIPNINPIPTPVAKGFKGVLANIAGLADITSGVGSVTSDVLARVAASIEKSAKVANKLSAGFGVFAAAFGVVSTFTNPSPQDILNKVNKAFAEMTKDVNNRLKTMEGYVDRRVIQLEQDLMKNQFAALQRFFTSCIREHNNEEVRKCQRYANKKIYGELPKFQKLSDQYKSGATTLKIYDIKRLEASLTSFRDYASLHLTSLQLLVNSYREDPYSEEKKRRLKLYLRDLKTFGKNYNGYAHWAYNLIHKRQIDENYGNNPTFDKVNKLTKSKGNFWNRAHTRYLWQIVHPECFPSDDKIPVNKCEMKAMIRTSGAIPGSPFREYWVGSTVYSYREVLRILAGKEAKKLCGKYMSAFKHDLETYWKKELLDVASIWKQVSEKASKNLDNLDEIMKEKPAATVSELKKTGGGGGSFACKKMVKIPGFKLALCQL